MIAFGSIPDAGCRMQDTGADLGGCGEDCTLADRCLRMPKGAGHHAGRLRGPDIALYPVSCILYPLSHILYRGRQAEPGAACR